MGDRSDTAPERLRGVRVAGRRPGGFGWRRLQVVAALGVVASLVVPMLIQLSVEPFLLAMVAPFVVGLLLMLRWPRVGAVWLGVVSLAVLVFSAPFLGEALTHPESLADFLPLVVLILSMLVGIVAAIPSFRQGLSPDASSRPALAVGVAAGALTVAAAIVSGVAFAGIESLPAQAGDVRLVTEDITFDPAGISADAGDISVHVTNRDSTRHTFTIDELGVDLNIPPDSAQRVTFAADPGTYRFYCRPHAPGMEGSLVVG
jgi:plastocyanin